MKGFFITIFGVLTFIFLFRWFGGLDRLSVEDIINSFNVYMVDIRDDFEPLLLALENLQKALQEFRYISANTTSDSVLLAVVETISNILSAIYSMFTSLCAVLVSAFVCLGLLISDIVDFMRLLGVLLFY